MVLAADFLAEKRFSFFSNYFSENEVQTRLDIVEASYFPSATIELWGDAREEALKLKTADLLQIDLINAAQLATMAANIQAGGYSMQQGMQNNSEFYSATPFGQQYEQLKKTIATTGFYF